MTKEEVIGLVEDKKAALIAPLDEIKAAVATIEVTVTGTDEDLKAQLDQAKADLAASIAELDALKVKEADEAAKLAQDEVDLVSVKAGLEVIQAKLAKDEDGLSKFKAILADLQAA